MRTRTYTWNGVEITLRAPTVRDRLNSEAAYYRLLGLLQVGDPIWAQKQYADFITSVEHTEGDLPFPIPQPTDDAKTLEAGMNAWLDADGDFYERWEQEYERVRATPNGAVLQPEVDPND